MEVRKNGLDTDRASEHQNGDGKVPTKVPSEDSSSRFTTKLANTVATFRSRDKVAASRYMYRLVTSEGLRRWSIVAVWAVATTVKSTLPHGDFLPSSV